jgi:O-succinylbenzoate synthase
LKIRFRHRRYRLPFRVSVRTAHGAWPEREGLLLRLEDEAGAVGWGEVAPLPEFGTESVDEAEAACRRLGKHMELAAFAAPEGMPCLGAALGAARSELEERRGPGVDTSPVPDAIPVCALLSAGAAGLGEIGFRSDAGFRTFKWKVGAGDADRELGLLDELCSALPAGARIRLDANGAWDRRMAERWLERCAGRPVEFVEQPVAAGTRGADDLLLGLARDYPTPLALDESLTGNRGIGRWLALGWPGVFVVKPSLLGAPADSLGRLAEAKAAVVFSSALETAVGARFALRAAFAWPGPPRALGFGVWPLFSDSRFDGPAAGPFLRRADVERIDPEVPWTALS